LSDKEYGHALSSLIPGSAYNNETDSQTDYFDKGTVTLFEDSPFFAAAKARAEANAAKWDAKYGA